MTTPRPTALVRRVGWVAADQVLSSATNVALTVVAARSLGIVGFGAFSVALAVSIAVGGMARALVTEPLLSRPFHASGDDRSSTFTAVAGAALAVGIGSMVLVGAAAIVLGGAVGGGLLALAVVLPVLLLQDAWRYCLITAGRPQVAVANDAVWALGQLVLLAFVMVTDRVSAPAIVLAWGGAGALAAIVGAVQVGAVPRLRAGRRWLSDQSDLGARYWVEFVTVTGVTQAALLGLGATRGLPAVGAVRAAQTLFGPFNVLYNATNLAVVPEAARRTSERHRIRHLMVLVSAGLLVVALAMTAIVAALPASLGRQVLGDSWEPARAILILTGLAHVAIGLSAGAVIGLRALAAARESLLARLLTLPPALAFPLLGAQVAGVRGFAVGTVAAATCTAAIFWWQFLAANRASPTSASPTGP